MSRYGRLKKDKVDCNELIKQFQEVCSSVNLDISYNNLFKIFILMISITSKYLYDNPNKRIEFPHFDIVRSNYLDNLIKIDIKRDKEVKNAEDLLGFNLSDGFDKRRFIEVMEEFVENLLDYSEQTQEKNQNIMKELENKRKKKGD